MTIEEIPKQKLRLDKLVDATNLEGEKNEKLFEIARDMEKKLSRFSNFIGIFPFGSRTKGYANENVIDLKNKTNGSDYYMEVLIVNDSYFEDLIVFLVKMTREYSDKGVLVYFNPTFINLSEIQRKIKFLDESLSSGIAKSDTMNVISLCGNGLGQKIDVWREKIKNEILKLPQEKREKMFQIFTDSLVRKDMYSLKKMSERIPDFNEKEYLNARRELWTKRVYKIFGE